MNFTVKFPFEIFHLIDILSLIARFRKRDPTPVSGVTLNLDRWPKPLQVTVRRMTSPIVLVEIDEPNLHICLVVLRSHSKDVNLPRGDSRRESSKVIGCTWPDVVMYVVDVRTSSLLIKLISKSLSRPRNFFLWL